LPGGGVFDEDDAVGENHVAPRAMLKRLNELLEQVLTAKS
jgi:hypothetical protein